MKILMGICFIGEFAFGIAVLLSAILMIAGRKKHVPIFNAELFWNPLAICLRPSLLNHQGLSARKWFIVFSIGCFISSYIAHLSLVETGN